MPIPLVVWLIGGAVAALAMSEKSTGDASPQPEPAAGNDPSTDGTAAGDATDPGSQDATISDGSDTTDSTQFDRSAQYDNFVTAFAQTPFHNIIAASEATFGIPENLYARQLYEESGFDPEAVGDGGAAVGITQMHEDAALDVRMNPADRSNPQVAIPKGAEYLKRLYTLTGNDWYSALVAYNWGIGNVLSKGVDAAPNAAIAYAESIMGDSNA